MGDKGAGGGGICWDGRLDVVVLGCWEEVASGRGDGGTEFRSGAMVLASRKCENADARALW